MTKRVDLDVRPKGPLCKNYDYAGPQEGSDVGPGTGLYGGIMSKYKSVQDFLNKSRGRRWQKKMRGKNKKALQEICNIIKQENEKRQ